MLNKFISANEFIFIHMIKIKYLNYECMLRLKKKKYMNLCIFVILIFNLIQKINYPHKHNSSL